MRKNAAQRNADLNAVDRGRGQRIVALLQESLVTRIWSACASRLCSRGRHWERSIGRKTSRRVIRDFCCSTAAVPSSRVVVWPSRNALQPADRPPGRVGCSYRRTRKIKRRNSPERDAVFPLRAAGGLLERRYKEPGNPLRRYARIRHHILAWPGLAWPAISVSPATTRARAHARAHLVPVS